MYSPRRPGPGSPPRWCRRGFPSRRRATAPKFVDLIGERDGLCVVEPPYEPILIATLDTGWTGRRRHGDRAARRRAENELVERHIGPVSRESAQHAGEQAEVLGFTQT